MLADQKKTRTVFASMQSIGERLEEARKRKGISLREAAEGTKIRSDFLGYIEQNKMDFDLPEIYKRGFLKNYARYLKLDVEKIMTDYNAQQLSNSRLGKKGGTEWFGQMEIKKSEAEASGDQVEPEEAAPYGRISVKSNPQEEPTEQEDEETNKTFYMKIGLIFVGTLALVFIVFGLIWAILGSGSADSDDISEILKPAENSELVDGTPPVIGNTDSIKLVASGNVYVAVKQQSDDQELYRNTMSEGESITLEKVGPVVVLFTAGENLAIEQADKGLIKPTASGLGRVTLP